jgi:DNA-binding GntR family transcriptional regulator
MGLLLEVVDGMNSYVYTKIHANRSAGQSMSARATVRVSSSVANSGARRVRHGARSEHVYRRLRDAIREGQFKSGDRMMEIDIADWLKVSRTPVRDALRRLEAEGMLQHEPPKGLVVARLDRQAVMELYVMRETLEGTAAGLCARHASDMEVLGLMELIDRERELQGDAEAVARHNRHFHEAIHRGAHNRYLEKSLAAVNDSMWLLGKPLMLLPHRAQQALEEHARIVNAIRRRDPDAAGEAARAHVRAAQRERLKRLFPDSRS